ncbi:MAG: flagellar protein FliT [Rhodoferax sp.]|uniref:flagellar protein FliT n=1 Tax=Rhodoferax sp. TaxID=50421 RepID=UPI003BB7DBA4
MGTQSEVMHCYEQIAPLTERMLMLARARQWGVLPALEAQCSDMVERLMAIEAQETLNQAQSGRKYRLLSRITANYAEIRSLVLPQLAKLGAVMKDQSQRQSLHQAYGQTDDVP